MSSELFILRHSKSDWDANGFSDHDRPLNLRGQQDAQQLAVWLKQKSLYPDRVICSTALRAKQTIQPIIEELDIDDGEVRYDDKLYLASLRDLLMVLSKRDPAKSRMMIVGHNPGLDELVSYLAAGPLQRTTSGKLMTTTCLAIFKMPIDWHDLKQRGELISMIRPGDISK